MHPVVEKFRKDAGTPLFAGLSWRADDTRNREFFYRHVLTSGNALLLYRERTIAFSLVLG
jgi:hypothetical protein